MTLRETFFVPLALSLIATGCADDPPTDEQALETAGRGRSIKVELDTPRPDGPDSADIVVLWLHDDAEVPVPFQVLRRDAAVPGEHTLRLPARPPEAAMLDEVHNESDPDQYSPAVPRIAEGAIVAMEPGAIDDPELVESLADFQDPAIFGFVVGANLIYLEGPIEPNTYMEQYACGAHPGGYHIMEGELAYGGDFADCPAFPREDEGSGGAMYALAPGDLATPLGIDLCADEFITCSE